MSVKPGPIIYGNDKYGNDIYKDSKGYYVILYDPAQHKIFKKYMKSKKTRKATVKRVCKGKGNTKKCKWTPVL